ncbi:MAG: hypothetical protein DRJ42_05620 [Deltaproteobacteria bacterium]|nr:MAG: hypothetical protein DRJ42_05620 [Deltaproteobacteria bacterium]
MATPGTVALEGSGVRNGVELGIILALIGLIFAGLGFLIAGRQTIHWGVVAGLAFTSVFFFRGPLAVLRRYRTRPLADETRPVLVECVERLSSRAGLTEVPDLRITDRDDCDAFSVGAVRIKTNVLGTELIAHLEPRHLEAVIAHEVSHIKNRDTMVMGVADLFVRMTRTMSHLGLLLLVVNGALTQLFDGGISWGFVAALICTPMLAKGLLMALGRARELRADRDAVKLTGDASALAEALVLFEKHAQPKRGMLRSMNPYGIAPAPSDIRNHPPTEMRVELLRAMA